jgi:hypothetical protein
MTVALLRARSCRDLSPEEIDELFFPESNRVVRRVAEMCGSCPAREACLADQLDIEWGLGPAREFVGIVAGYTPKERRVMVRLRIQREGPPVRYCAGPGCTNRLESELREVCSHTCKMRRLRQRWNGTNAPTEEGAA